MEKSDHWIVGWRPPSGRQITRYKLSIRLGCHHASNWHCSRCLCVFWTTTCIFWTAVYVDLCLEIEIRAARGPLDLRDALKAPVERSRGFLYLTQPPARTAHRAHAPENAGSPALRRRVQSLLAPRPLPF